MNDKADNQKPEDNPGPDKTGNSPASRDFTDAAGGRGPRLKIIPPGENRERLVCPDCDHIAYENPKIINNAVVVYEDKILLCRRAIEPRAGYWTLPGGFMELGETVQEGAVRETKEEAGADIRIGPLLGIYHTPTKTQVLMIFRAEMTSPHFESGVESLETRLFAWEDIPWTDLAFPMVAAGLRAYERTRGLTDFQPEIAVLPRLKPSTAPKPPNL